ncbi:hypothetical protein DPMN_023619 [Dreissena polymorpha]|uniref:Uncharacterized protein n=1 Tax=Dreissena polymorpha TaxID=45954 RepID=A0A9D4RA26_DREPO|nr:hypothetical protein DPMN_023619 [Dreissena polymorpha]
MLITLLVCLWIDSVKLNGSMCEIYSSLLNTMFKKACDKKGYFHSPPVKCFANTSHLRPHVATVDALAKAAFQFLFANKTEKTLVFSESELSAYLTDEQKDFSLNAGVLSEKKSFSRVSQSSKISFHHETMQEFLAAFHIANSANDTDAILNLLCKKRYCVLDLEHLFTFLCGLNVHVANRLLCTLNDNEINTEVSQSTIERSCRFHVKSDYEMKYILEEFDNRTVYQCLKQLVIIAGYTEAKANRHEDIHLNITDFLFSDNLNGNETTALKDLLLTNKSNVRTLIIDNNALHENDVLNVLASSAGLIETFCSIGNPEFCKALENTNVQTLALTKVVQSSHLFRTLHTLARLEYLFLDNCNIIDLTGFTRPPLLKTIRLKNCKCFPDGLRSLLINLSKQDRTVKCELLQCFVISNKDLKLMYPQMTMHTSVDSVKSFDMSNIQLKISKDSLGLYETLRDTSLRTLNVDEVIHASLLSETIPSLTKLAELRIVSFDFDRFDFQFPPSLKFVKFQNGMISSDWLFGTLVRLSKLGHSVRCLIFNCAVKSLEGTQLREKDMKPDYNLYDVSNIKLELKRTSLELYEALDNTNIRFLKCIDVYHVSRLLETSLSLTRLECLHFVATNFGTSEFRMPPSLRLAEFQRCSFSSEWLLKMLCNLASVDHTVHCILDSCAVQSLRDQEQTVSSLDVINLRSNDLFCDMSNIKLEIRKDCIGVFETLSGINIRMLMLKQVTNFSCVDQALPTLTKLEKLYIVGGTLASFDLQPHPSVKLFKFIRASCPSTWFRRFLVRLSTMQHLVKCCISKCDVTLDANFKETDSDSCGAVTETLPRSGTADITLEVAKDCPGLYKALRGTGITRLTISNAENGRLLSQTIPTISKLEELTITNAKLFNLDLPLSLRYVHFKQCSFPFHWLDRLFLKLSLFCHSVRCCIETCVVIDIGANKKTDSQFSAVVSDCRMAQIQLEVQKVSLELYEALCNQGIKIITVAEGDVILPS